MTKKEDLKRKNRKFILLAAVLGGVLVMGTVSIVASSGLRPGNMFGGLGSAHEHAAFMVMIEGQPIDFSQQKYQVKSQYIHVENGVGTVLHKHAIRVPVGEFFSSVGMQVTSNCFVSDDGSSYCNGDDKKLRFFLNGIESDPSAINNYVLNENDRILLYYGEDSESAIQDALNSVGGFALPQS